MQILITYISLLSSPAGLFISKMNADERMMGI